MNLPSEFKTWPWLDRQKRLDPLKLLVFALLFLPAAWITLDALSGLWLIPVVGIVYWSGVWATILLLATLAITPLRRIFQLNRLIGLRRMLGVGALLYSIGHTIAYFALRFFEFDVIAGEMITRLTLIVATLSLLGLFALGVTSFDAAVRRMGSQNWHRLHRLTYIFTGLAVFHFLLSPGATGGLPYLMCGLYVWLMAWRYYNARRQGTDLLVLAWLAVATTALTVFLEAFSPAVRFGMDPMQTLLFNFSTILGVSPGWQMLMWSGGVFLAAAVHQKIWSPRKSMA